MVVADPQQGMLAMASCWPWPQRSPASPAGLAGWAGQSCRQSRFVWGGRGEGVYGSTVPILAYFYNCAPRSCHTCLLSCTASVPGLAFPPVSSSRQLEVHHAPLVRLATGDQHLTTLLEGSNAWRECQVAIVQYSWNTCL